MTLKKNIWAFALLGSIAVTNSTFAKSNLTPEANPIGIISEEEQTLEQSYMSLGISSKILGEKRELLIHLPSEYANSKKHYPVVYILDGKRHLPHAMEAENILQNESLIPSSIIVAITNNQGTRGRDLSREKERFLKFISDEVFPIIAKRFRTSDHKTLFGHSMAGAFTLNTLAKHPHLFDNYIAASPVIQINNAAILDQFTTLTLPNALPEKSLFISFGNENAEGKAATQAYNKFVNLLKDKPIQKLNWQHHTMPQQVHMTTPYLTLYAGLSFVFSDYQTPRYSALKDYLQRGGMDGLAKYYRERANKYQESEEIPETALRSLGFVIFDDGHQSKGLNILKLNATQYPDSFRAINALAQAYEDAGQTKEALSAYRKGLKLAEEKSSRNTAYFKRQVERLVDTKS